MLHGKNCFPWRSIARRNDTATRNTPTVLDHQLIAELIVPPINLLILAIVAALLPWQRAGRTLLAIALAGLLVLALPAVGQSLLASLETGMAGPPGAEPRAIVILSADTVRSVAQPGGEIAPLTLDRVRAGAALARRTGLPILVTGGVVPPGTTPIATIMARSLAEDFHMPARWVEDRAKDTWQNAAFSAAMLRADGIGQVYLVTDGWHMRRSLLSFRRAGLVAVPAPVRLDPSPRLDWTDFLPVVSAWQRSYFALHEWIGIAYYSLR